MSLVGHQVHRKEGWWTYPPPPEYSPPFVAINFHTEPPPSSSPSSATRISPAVLFIIVILAVLFFISGILHLLVRFLIKHPSSSASSPSRYPDVSNADVLQRQLQQLFTLHDSGLDQAFIDALPVFMYKEIVGIKEPFDCAVCLSEFSEMDKLRLLPVCSHAFHIDCIDTWLLSNSTCPLCRGTLFTPGFSIENPIFYFDDPREEDYYGNCDGGLSNCQKTVETEEIVKQKSGFPVRLGKFRKLDNGSENAGGETSSSNMDARRCYSMGSYQYVVNEANLMVSLRGEQNNHDRQFVGDTDESGNPVTDEDLHGKKLTIGTKADSYSVSKIWLWSKKGKFASSSASQHQ